MSLIAYFPLEQNLTDSLNISPDITMVSGDFIYDPDNNGCLKMSDCCLCMNLSINTTVSQFETSMFVWVKLDSYTSDRSCVFINGNYLTINAQGYLSVHSYGLTPNGYHDYTGEKIEIGKWYHIGVAWGDKKCNMYLNGDMVRSIEQSAGMPVKVDNYQVGREGSSRRFNGSMKTIKVYDHFVEDSEAKRVYNTEMNYRGLIGQWFVDGNITDRSIFCNDMVKYTGNVSVNNSGVVSKSTHCSTCMTKVGTQNVIPALNSSMTMCGWVNIQTLDSNGGTMNGLFGLHNHSGNSNIGVNVKYITSTTMKMCCSVGYTDGSREFNTKLSNTSISYRKWHHLTLVYNHPSKKIHFYIDGMLDNTFSIGSKTVKFTPEIFITNQWSTTYDNYSPACIYNDVRLYNYDLSPKEIYDISLGKAFHYQLNDNSTGSINLEYFKPLENVWGLGNSGWCTSEVGFFHGRKCRKFTIDYPGGDQGGWKGAYLNYSSSALTSKNVINGDLVCRSFDILLEPHGNANKHYPIVSIEGNSSEKEYKQVDRSLYNVWQRVYCSSRIIDITATNNYLLYFYSSSQNIPFKYIVYVSDAQLEKNKYPSPFFTDQVDGLVTDISGYGRDINLSYSAPNPGVSSEITRKGDYSYFFHRDTVNKNHRYMKYSPFSFDVENGFTFSAWYYKKADMYQDSGVFSIGRLGENSYIDHYDGAIRFKPTNTTSTSSVTLNNADIPLNTWTHITFTLDSSNMKVYKNGVLLRENTVNTNDCNSNLSDKTLNIGFSGAGGAYRIFTGCISDVRIYGKALLPDDIAQICKVAAEVDNQGNLYVNTLKEHNYTPSLTDYKQSFNVDKTTLNILNLTRGGGGTHENINMANPKGETESAIKHTKTSTGQYSTGTIHWGNIPVDRTKKYRFSFWFKCANYRDSNYFYFGHKNAAGVVCNFGTTTENTNFYPYATNYSSMKSNGYNEQWVLIVGYVFPYGYTGPDDERRGFYLADGTKKGHITSANWASTISIHSLRWYASYQYSDNDEILAETYIMRLRFEECNGNEPSLEELIDLKECRAYTSSYNGVNAAGCMDASMVTEAFTGYKDRPNITLLKSDNGEVIECLSFYDEGEYYIAPKSKNSTICGVSFISGKYKPIDTNLFSSRVVYQMDKNNILVNTIKEY